MKQLLITIAAVVLVGCGESDHQHSHDHGHSHADGDHDHTESDGHDNDKELKAAETAKPEPPTAKAPDISIHEAVAIENTKAVKQHLDAGTDVNAKVGVGKTPLHNAIRLGNIEIAELLIAKGADVNAKFDDGINGHTALDIATSCFWRRPETASLLSNTEPRRANN